MSDRPSRGLDERSSLGSCRKVHHAEAPGDPNRRDVDPDAKRQLGQTINELVQRVEAAIEDRRAVLQGVEEEQVLVADISMHLIDALEGRDHRVTG